MVPWQNLESDRVGADARATRRGRLWAVRPTARARPRGAAIHQKGTLTSAFLFWPVLLCTKPHVELPREPLRGREPQCRTIRAGKRKARSRGEGRALGQLGTPTQFKRSPDLVVPLLR